MGIFLFRGKMVQISNIEEKPVERFLNYETFNEIKDRLQRLPHGEYYYDEKKSTICCVSKDVNGGFFVREVFQIPLHPGLIQFLTNVKKDMENLVRHVENAELENDYLIAKNEELLQKYEELKDKLSYY